MKIYLWSVCLVLVVVAAVVDIPFEFGKGSWSICDVCLKSLKMSRLDPKVS